MRQRTHGKKTKWESLQQSAGRASVPFEGQRNIFKFLKIETITFHSLTIYPLNVKMRVH